jgi:glutamate synthase (NADPH/NADH) small chain
MELSDPDENGRRRPVVIPNSEFVIDANVVIMAIGTSPNPLIKQTTQGLDVNRWGGIIVNDDGKTSLDGVYAGGDAVTGASTVISAMGAGKIAAKATHEYIQSKN